MFYHIEMEELNKTLPYFWNDLNDPLSGFRSKAFSASLTGIPWASGQSGKVLLLYLFGLFGVMS
jgi:hypothetical protein